MGALMRHLNDLPAGISYSHAHGHRAGQCGKSIPSSMHARGRVGLVVLVRSQSRDDRRDDIVLSHRQKDFLLRLADLCDELQAEFSYSNEDDGIHIELDGTEVFADFLSGDAGKALRAAAFKGGAAKEQ